MAKPSTVKMTFQMVRRIHRQLKAVAAFRGKKVTAILNDLAAEYVEEARGDPEIAEILAMDVSRDDDESSEE